MSKASQRKEAERQKRLARDVGNDGELIKKIRMLGAKAMDDPEVMWKLVADGGSKGKRSRQSHEVEQLNEIVDDHENDIATLVAGVRGCPTDIGYSEEGSDIAVQGYAIAETLDGSLETRWTAMSITGSNLSSMESAGEMLFKRLEGQLHEGRLYDVAIWIFGVVAGGEATVVLALTRSGTRTARVLVNGKWISGKNTDQMWKVALDLASEDVRRAPSAEDGLLNIILKLMMRHGIDIDAMTKEEKLHFIQEANKGVGIAQYDMLFQCLRLVDALAATSEQRDVRKQMETELVEHARRLEKTAARSAGELERTLEETRRQVRQLSEELGRFKSAAAVNAKVKEVPLNARMKAMLVG